MYSGLYIKSNSCMDHMTPPYKNMKVTLAKKKKIADIILNSNWRETSF